MAKVKHPNIITVYKILEINSVIYMIMDYCKYGDLLEYIKCKGPFNEEHAKVVFRSVKWNFF